MSAQQQLRILDEEPTDDEQTVEQMDLDGGPDAPGQPLYEQGTSVDLIGALPRQGRQFVRALADELDKDDLIEDLRRLDRLHTGDSDDVEWAELFVLEDESVMFVGSDPTTKDAVPLFAFVVERHEPVPAPTSAQSALDLLRPADVQDAFAEDVPPDRQGEWWLLPTDQVPVSSPFRPGLESKPFGPSPLDSHVPREYAFNVPDYKFMNRLRSLVDELPQSIKTPPTAIEWIHQQRRKQPRPEYAPDWETIREVAGEVYVRGTLRHRDDDHYVESIGEDWHRAITHNMDVYTGDDYVDRVVID